MARTKLPTRVKQSLTKNMNVQSKKNLLVEKFLDLIIVAEGTDNDGRNPYDTIIGFKNTATPLTSKTIGTVRKEGRGLVNRTRGDVGQGRTQGSSAVGAFQMLSNEFKGGKVVPYSSVVGELQKKLGLPDSTLFTEEIQRDLAREKVLTIADKEINKFTSNPTEKNLESVLNKLGQETGWQGIPTKTNPNKTEMNFEEAKYLFGVGGDAFTVRDYKELSSELDIVKSDSSRPSSFFVDATLKKPTMDEQMSQAMDTESFVSEMRDDNNRMDEQEINAGDKSIESQSQQQRGVTEQSSELGFISPAEGATLSDIPPKVKTTRSGLAKRDPMTLRNVAFETGTKLEDRYGAEEVEKSPGLDLP